MGRVERRSLAFGLSRVVVVVALALVCGRGLAAHAEPPMPDHLPRRHADDDSLSPVAPLREPLSTGDYAGMLAAGYLLALPGAAMTAGVGLLLPVGMHYHHGNPAGGMRAFWGIVAALGAGGLIGGWIDPPQHGFRFTPGIIAGSLSGFFAFGLVDVLFFARVEPPSAGGLALDLDVRPGDGAGLRVRGRL